MTVPSVLYRFKLQDGSTVTVDNPQYYPDPTSIVGSAEPYIKATIFTPDRYMGAIMKLCMERRGVNSRVHYPAPGRLEITIDMPLAEVIVDFYDKLKTVTQGYGSLDYELTDYRESDLVKLDILVNGEKVDALSVIVHKERARELAVQICDRLQREIPRHQFKIAIQGAIGGKIISRSTVNAFPEGRDRQMLRRGHHTETKAPRKAEEGQEADEDGGLGHDPPERLRGGVEVGR